MLIINFKLFKVFQARWARTFSKVCSIHFLVQEVCRGGYRTRGGRRDLTGSNPVQNSGSRSRRKLNTFSPAFQDLRESVHRWWLLPPPASESLFSAQQVWRKRPWGAVNPGGGQVKSGSGWHLWRERFEACFTRFLRASQEDLSPVCPQWRCAHWVFSFSCLTFPTAIPVLPAPEFSTQDLLWKKTKLRRPPARPWPRYSKPQGNRSYRFLTIQKYPSHRQAYTSYACMYI